MNEEIWILWDVKDYDSWKVVSWHEDKDTLEREAQRLEGLVYAALVKKWEDDGRPTSWRPLPKEERKYPDERFYVQRVLRFPRAVDWSDKEVKLDDLVGEKT